MVRRILDFFGSIFGFAYIHILERADKGLFLFGLIHINKPGHTALNKEIFVGVRKKNDKRSDEGSKTGKI